MAEPETFYEVGRPLIDYEIGHEAAPTEVPSLVVMRESPRKYRVWFATNRQLVETPTKQVAFGTERDDQLHYGCCEVGIPKYHKIGSLGTPWWKRWPVWHDERLRLVSTSPVDL